MKPILYALFAIILSFRTAFCSIYPTRPTSETIFVVGRTERLTWKDSRQRPYLNETSPCDIALYSNTTDYVGTFATQVRVAATNHTQAVYLNPNWDYQTGTYYIRFICGSLIVYTADFAIKTDDSGSATAGAIQVSFIDSGTTQVTLISSPTPAPASTVDPSAIQNKVSNAARRRFDHELLWIGWPVVVGISLAL